MTTTELRTIALLIALTLLSGCASQSSPPISAGLLKPDWQPAQRLQIDLDGRSYRGEWHTQPCHTDACRGAFRNAKRYERSHVERGDAQLTSADGARLDCEWASFRTRLEGVCRTPDDRIYALRDAE